MRESYIAAKERWARKMAGQYQPTVRSTDRLPAGQRQVHNFPVLDLGVRPEVPLDKWEWNGNPLSIEHGGPARVIISKRYAWKGAKFIREITFLDRDIRGFWEIRGYSNTADPWTEDRFAVENETSPRLP